MDRRAASLVVVGASAGGVEGRTELVSGLPPDLAAAVGVVLHVSPNAESRLPAILSRAGPLPAGHAGRRQAIETGRIVVAPPDLHLIVRDGLPGHARQGDRSRPSGSGAAAGRHRPCGG